MRFDGQRFRCHDARPLGRVPKWPKGTDCKSVIRGFKSHRGLSGQPRSGGAVSFLVGIWLALLAWVQIPPRPGLGQTDPPGVKPHGIPTGFVDFISPYHFGYGFVSPPRHSGADATFGPSADHQTQPTQPRFGGAVSLFGWDLARFARVGSNPTAAWVGLVRQYERGAKQRASQSHAASVDVSCGTIRLRSRG